MTNPPPNQAALDAVMNSIAGMVMRGFECFLIFCLGWSLTGFISTDGLPVAWKPVVAHGGALVGGVGAVVVWLYGVRPAGQRIARWLGCQRTELKALPVGLRMFRLLCVGMSVFGLLPLWHDWQEFHHFRWLGSFQAVEATVTGVRVDEVEREGRRGLAPRVLYDFFVKNQKNSGSRIHWEVLLQAGPEGGGRPPPISSVIWSQDDGARRTLENFLEQYPAGKTLTAYHDPNQPDNCCLIFVPSVPLGSGFWFVATILGVMWTIFFIALRQVQRRQG